MTAESLGVKVNFQFAFYSVQGCITMLQHHTIQ